MLLEPSNFNYTYIIEPVDIQTKRILNISFFALLLINYKSFKVSSPLIY